MMMQIEGAQALQPIAAEQRASAFVTQIAERQIERENAIENWRSSNHAGDFVDVFGVAQTEVTQAREELSAQQRPQIPDCDGSPVITAAQPKFQMFQRGKIAVDHFVENRAFQSAGLNRQGLQLRMFRRASEAQPAAATNP